MIVLRDKSYSGYQPILGTGYIDSAQIKQGVDDGIYRMADHLDKAVDYADNVHPVVSKASRKWRNRITGYTRPLKKLLRPKKNEKKKSTSR